MSQIRNFAIIAHVDHGKSTLADRLLEITGTIQKGKHEDQMLDRNPISRERGITIKLAPVRMEYHTKNTKSEIRNYKQITNSNTQNSNNLELSTSNLEFTNSEYILNLIDTPGHVDFSYEVDRTLACVEGVILLVDATQGIQAQTVANCYKALSSDLIIMPVINKIDLPSADVERVKGQIIELLGVDATNIHLVSAKTGQGVPELLDIIVRDIPPPEATSSTSHGLIFDSYYDPHRGVIAFVRIFGGGFAKGDQLVMSFSGVSVMVLEVGIFTPDLVATAQIDAGEIGYIVTNLKDIHQVRVGDTVTLKGVDYPPLPGYKIVKPMVYASFFTTDPNDYPNLKRALEKLYLNDSALSFSSIHSRALGAGFRVGFLGLLHADVTRARLEREYALDLILNRFISNKLPVKRCIPGSYAF